MSWIIPLNRPNVYGAGFHLNAFFHCSHLCPMFRLSSYQIWGQTYKLFRRFKNGTYQLNYFQGRIYQLYVKPWHERSGRRWRNSWRELKNCCVCTKHWKPKRGIQKALGNTQRPLAKPSAPDNYLNKSKKVHGSLDIWTSMYHFTHFALTSWYTTIAKCFHISSIWCAAFTGRSHGKSKACVCGCLYFCFYTGVVSWEPCSQSCRCLEVITQHGLYVKPMWLDDKWHRELDQQTANGSRNQWNVAKQIYTGEINRESSLKLKCNAFLIVVMR